MKIHHVGIVCRNIERAVRDYRKLFNVITQSETVHDPLQDADLCMLTTDTGLDVEFIAGPQVENLRKARINYYHVCYTVDNLECEIERMTDNGAVVVSEPKPAILFGGKRVAFLIASSGLIELLEE